MHRLDGLPRVEDTPTSGMEENFFILWLHPSCRELSHGGHVIIVDAEVSVRICGWPVGGGIFAIGLGLVGGVWSCPTDVIHHEYVLCACAVRDEDQP